MALMFWQPWLSFLAVLSGRYCSGCPALIDRSKHSCPDSPVLTVLFLLSCSGCPVAAVLSRLSCSDCSVLTFLSWQYMYIYVMPSIYILYSRYILPIYY
jgi:hypothetical protein